MEGIVVLENVVDNETKEFGMCVVLTVGEVEIAVEIEVEIEGIVVCTAVFEIVIENRFVEHFQVGIEN